MQMLMCSAEGCHAGGSPDTTHLMERLETPQPQLHRSVHKQLRILLYQKSGGT